MDTIINFISEHYPTIALFLALLTLAVVVTFKAAMYHVSIQNTRQKVDESPCDAHTKKLDALPCDLHTKALDLHTKTLDKVSEALNESIRKLASLPCNLHSKVLDKHSLKLDELKTEVVEVKMDVVEMRVLMRLQFSDPLAQKKSPLSLTEEGEKIASKNNLNAIIDVNWSKINASLQDLKTKNPYDIQEFCFDTAFADTTGYKELKFFPCEDIDKMKIVAFKAGYPVLLISRVMAILIRDRYFAENNINIDGDEEQGE